MKRLSAFYFILFFAYLLFLLFALLIMTGCGTDAPMETAAELSLPPAPLGSWEEPAGPSLALYVASAGGRLYYIPAPEELSARLEELAVNGPRLSGMTREWLEGWGDQLPAGVDELAVYYSAGASGFVPVYRNGAGEYGLAGAYADEEVRSLLRLVDHTGWDFAADLADFSGLRKLELMLDGQPLVTVTDAERLRAMEELLQSESRAVSPSKTPNEVIALRCTLADGSERTLVADPDSPRFWLPPCCYYRYNAYESTGVQPLLDILGLEAWPQSLLDGINGDAVAALYERLAPAPRPRWGTEELLFRLPTIDWTARSERKGSGETVRELYALADAMEETEPDSLSTLQILAGAGRADGALAEAYDYLLSKLYDRDPALYARCWQMLDEAQKPLALPLLSWDLSLDQAIEKID